MNDCLKSRETEHGDLLDHLERLSRMDLSGASFRVLLWAERRALCCAGARSWTVPVEVIAAETGMHRNSVGRALAELVAAGLLERQAVPHRGAPTRTVLRPWRRSATTPASRMQAAGAVQRPKDHVAPVQPEIEAPAAPTPIQAPAQPRTGGPAMGPDACLRLLRRLPEAAHQALARATLACDPDALQPDPAWGLAQEDVAVLQAMVPRRRAGEAAACSPPRPLGRQDEAVAIPERLAAALLALLPPLAKAIGEDAAKSKLDEIACMVLAGGLGRGDLEGGARAGAYLVRAGRWTTPRQFSARWRGAVAAAGTVH